MKASPWSTAASKPPEPVRYTVTEVSGAICLVLRRRNANGTYQRMRVLMTKAEVEELVPEGPRRIPKV